MDVAFIGLGKMGAAMAQNLLAAGHRVTVYNRTIEKTKPLAEAGASVSRVPAEAVTGAEAVFTMLADDGALSETVAQFEPALEPQTIHIGCSTVSVALAKQLAEDHAEAGQLYISAPVFGRPDAAEKKRLVVVAAGSDALVKRSLPLFEAIGRQTFVAGTEPWMANAIKLCGNFMIASMLESFSEAFAALKKAGIDPNRFVDVILEVFGSPVYSNYGRAMANRNFNGAGAGFALALGLKDVRLVSQFSESLQAPMPLASLLRDHLVSAIANGQGDFDWTSLALVLERNAGIKS